MTSPAPVVISGVDGLRTHCGRHLGYSRWHLLPQSQIDAFADVTGDHQWVHVDAERARCSVYGTTIAHGMLTLALLPVLKDEIVDVRGFALVINYGCDRVRFPAPVPAGARIRAGLTLDSAEPIAEGVHVAMTATCHIEGAAKPSCVATLISRFYE